MTTRHSTTDKRIADHRAMTSLLGKLAYTAVLVAVVLLAATGIGTFAIGKAPMSHWVLMLHVAAAPLFALGLALVALTWSSRYRFDDPSSQQGCTVKTLFWLILLSGLVVILSGVLPMTPIFGTAGQHQLYLIHRYSGIVLTAALLLHLISPKRTG